jgi:hypothetical protein
MALGSISAFAVRISYENLPSAKIIVKTQGAPYSSKIVENHKQDQQASLEDLKAHVQTQLGRQVIEAKCGESRAVIYSSEQGLQSECSVSFL